MPLGLFPWVVHLRAILVILDTGILRTYPSHLKRLCCISLRTHVEFVISSIMRRIKERHTIQWPREKGQTMIYKTLYKYKYKSFIVNHDAQYIEQNNSMNYIHLISY